VSSARFQVVADQLDHAQTIGIRRFADTLSAAGMDAGWNVVEGDDDPDEA
jgi:hypothetical protein